MIIFKSPHTYVMSWLYIVCFGTFIGFSSSFPKLIQDIFGYVKCPQDVGDGTGLCPNPNAPPADIYAFLGPLLGALIRPFGAASEPYSRKTSLKTSRERALTRACWADLQGAGCRTSLAARW